MAERAGDAAPARAHGLRTILTHVDGAEGSDQRLGTAIDLARSEDAHLTVLSLGYEPSVQAYAYGDGLGVAMADITVQVREETEQRVIEVRERLAREGLTGDAMGLVAIYREMQDQIASVARFADLVLASAPYAEGAPDTAVDVFEGTLYRCDTPVLVCPPGDLSLDPARILVGWDGSRQALRAVRAALPFLKRARAVEISIFDPSDEAPGDALASMLARHGVTVEVAAMPHPPGSTAVALARRAEEIDAQLMVIGAFGHSRLRESVIGGVTRDLLVAPQLPVLLAH